MSETFYTNLASFLRDTENSDNSCLASPVFGEEWSQQQMPQWCTCDEKWVTVSHDGRSVHLELNCWAESK